MTPHQTLPIETWDLNPTDGIFYENKDWIQIEDTNNGRRIAQYDNRNIVIEIPHAEFEELRNAGLLTIRRFKYLKQSARLDSVVSDAVFNDFSPHQKRITWFRVDMCMRMLDGLRDGTLSLSEDKLRPALEAFWSSWVIEDHKRNTADGRHGSKAAPSLISCPSTTTAKRWLRVFRACDYHPMSLMNGYGKSGNRRSKVSAFVKELLEKHARSYIDRRQPTKAAVYRNLVRELKKANAHKLSRWDARPESKKPHLHKIPCLDTLYRAIRRLNQFEVLAGRIGPDAAAKQLAIFHGGMGELRLMERVEMDDWEVPLQVLLENAGIWAKLPKKAQKQVARRKVRALTAIERSSRICLGIKLVFVPTAAAAVETLNLSSNDKTTLAQMAGCQRPWNMRGFAFNYATDNGVYKEPAFRGALADVRVTHHLMPTGSPSARAPNERSYRTLVDQLIAWFSGLTFSNPIVRGDYDSEGNAVIDIEELGRILIRFIVDVYHLTSHEGLNGKTPLDVWNEKRRIYRVIPPLGSDQNRHVFGVPVKADIGNHGIRFLGLNYQSAALQRLRAFPTSYQVKRPSGRIDRKATIKVDPLNLGAISVRTIDGWITVPCQIAGMENVPIIQWHMAFLKVRRDNLEQAKVYEETVLEALEAIQQLADNAIIRANIASPILTQKAFEKFERELFSGFAVAMHDKPDADALDFGSAETAVLEAPLLLAEETPRDVNDDPLFGFEG